MKREPTMTVDFDAGNRVLRLRIAFGPLLRALDAETVLATGSAASEMSGALRLSRTPAPRRRK